MRATVVSAWVPMQAASPVRIFRIDSSACLTAVMRAVDAEVFSRARGEGRCRRGFIGTLHVLRHAGKEHLH
jgi:hypothetical protein